MSSRAAIDATRAGGNRRASIIALAAKLFDEQGYHRASMELLAQEAGIAKPTLYHYFSSKEEILFEIHQEFIRPLIDQHQLRSGPDLTPSAQLRGAMTDIMSLMESHHGHVRVFFEHHRELTGVRRVEVRDQRNRYQQMIEATIRAGIEQREFRDLDVRLAALALFGMCNWGYQWFRKDGAMNAEEVASFLWELLMRGLCTDGTVPTPQGRT